MYIVLDFELIDLFYYWNMDTDRVDKDNNTCQFHIKLDHKYQTLTYGTINI